MLRIRVLGFQSCLFYHGVNPSSLERFPQALVVLFEQSFALVGLRSAS
jgi:hypothetical protein